MCERLRECSHGNEGVDSVDARLSYEIDIVPPAQYSSWSA